MSVFKNDIFKQRTVLITGGGSGIGQQIAMLLGQHGANIAICGRREDVLRDTSSLLEEANIKCFYQCCDIRYSTQVQAMVDATSEHFGSIDGLVNNAAGNFPASIENMSYNGFKSVVDIDLLGTFNVSKACFDTVFKDSGGVIVNISAPFEGQGVAWQAHCAAAKSGVNSLTRTCAVEWMPLGIRVNAVAPGHIEQTEGVDKLAEQLTNTQRSQRKGSKTDIANAVLFLLSDAAKFINGEVIRVDGGTGVDSLKMPVYPS